MTDNILFVSLNLHPAKGAVGMATDRQQIAGVFDVTTEFLDAGGSVRSAKDDHAALTQVTSPIFVDFHRITSMSMATAFAMLRQARSAVSTLTPNR